MRTTPTDISVQDRVDLERWNFTKNNMTLNTLAYRMLVSTNHALIEQTPESMQMLCIVERHIRMRDIDKHNVTFQFMWGTATNQFYLIKTDIQKISPLQSASILNSLDNTEWIAMTSDVLNHNQMYKQMSIHHGPSF